MIAVEKIEQGWDPQEYSVNHCVAVCHWDTKTLEQDQLDFAAILTIARLNTKNPYHIRSQTAYFQAMQKLYLYHSPTYAGGSISIVSRFKLNRVRKVR